MATDRCIGSNPISSAKEYRAPLAQLEEARALKVLKSRFESEGEYQNRKFACVAQLEEAVVLDAIQWEFESLHGHQKLNMLM